MTNADHAADIVRALAVVREILRDRGEELGANLGNELRKEFPHFRVQDHGFASLTHFLSDAADDIIAVGKYGNEWVWALGSTLADQDLVEASPIDALVDTTPLSGSLNRVALRNFRACRDVTLDLDDSGLTALVGPNSSGKSTLLQAIFLGSQITQGKPVASFSGSRDVRRLRTNGATSPLEIKLSAGDLVALSLSAEPEGDDTHFIISLASRRLTKLKKWDSSADPPPAELRRYPESRLFWPSVLLRFRAEALARPSDVVEGEPRVKFDGEGLPTFLAYLANADRERLQRLIASVREVVPAVEETRQTLQRRDPGQDRPMHGSARSEYQYALDVKMKGAGWIPADLLSEGTLFAFGLHAILHHRVPPRIILMDDIDRGLHPKAQRALIRQIKEIPKNNGPRLVITTHSPYILDELPPESVRVVRADEHGTRVRALTDHPEWQEWKNSMTSGEFWTYVGEDWLEQGT